MLSHDIVLDERPNGGGERGEGGPRVHQAPQECRGPRGTGK